MKLVLIYKQTDAFSQWTTENTVPIEYDSAEAASTDFEVAASEAQDVPQWHFTFAGRVFPSECFFNAKGYSPPRILTVDEWFARPQ